MRVHMAVEDEHALPDSWLDREWQPRQVDLEDLLEFGLCVAPRRPRDVPDLRLVHPKNDVTAFLRENHEILAVFDRPVTELRVSWATSPGKAEAAAGAGHP